MAGVLLALAAYTLAQQQHGIIAGPDGAPYIWTSECTLVESACTGTSTTAASAA